MKISKQGHELKKNQDILNNVWHNLWGISFQRKCNIMGNKTNPNSCYEIGSVQLRKLLHNMLQN